MDFETIIVGYLFGWGVLLMALCALIRYISSALNAGSTDDE